MIDTSSAPESIFSQLISLIGIIVWPLTLLLCVLTQRKFISRMLSALASLAESANKIKIWQVEVEKTIDQEVQKAADLAEREKNPEVPTRDAVAAGRVETLVSSLHNSDARDDISESIRLKMLSLGSRYDLTRERMERGPKRTNEMNRIVARMRALAIAAKPFLAEFSSNESSAGVRLCAIAVLQMAPSSQYIEWLGQRFLGEEPFVFYQASVALKQCAAEIGYKNKKQLERVITAALATVRGFKGGMPDQNTIHILNLTLEALKRDIPSS